MGVKLPLGTKYVWMMFQIVQRPLDNLCFILTCERCSGEADIPQLENGSGVVISLPSLLVWQQIIPGTICFFPLYIIVSDIFDLTYMRHRYKKYFLDCLSDMLYLNSKSSVNHKLCEVNFIGSFSSDYIYKALLSLGLTEHCRRGGKIVRAIGSREFAVRQSPNNVRSITHKVSQKTQT